ncbi:sensor domain-containing diguanylate cyclase [Novosphingobium olei]|uniref:diguanylate cyclase n=1 Tax=Novosphingobium olei TaxID=2728851 RepID=A0A7Y0BQY1_9SPHN|nr:GGDEF domain-containing protein [Novosphingobium olei]NML94768.1 GGDEF domain-containing protein [Novosphingobium olei]
MSEEDSAENGRRSRWRQWFGLGQDDDDDEGNAGASVASAVPAASGSYRDPTAREIWLPAKRRMLGKVADFLIDHDLEILPYTLGIAYDCVTGASPRLVQMILERTERGLPVTLRWLDEAVRDAGTAKAEDTLHALMEQLEGDIASFGDTMKGAQDATSEYNTALTRHVDSLHAASSTQATIAELTALTRAMIEHTRTMQGDLARSEKRAQELQATLEETRRAADQDHLTGLPNRRAFDHLFDRELREAQARKEPLSVAFVDIDHFKRINDTHGHPAGDRVLRVVAETLDRISDARCHVARHGGEEFAVLFRGLTLQQAWKRLDGARAEIAERRLVNRATDMPFGQVTFSGGLADVFAYPGKSAAMKAADEALYTAKESGRNQIVMASAPPGEPVRKAA